MSHFTYHPEIKNSDIDAFGHVNNEVYLRWLLEAASAHSASVGYPTSRFVELGAGFVVRRHELEYLLPVFLNDEIKVETWNQYFEGASGFRSYEIVNSKSGKAVLTAKSKFVYVDLKTGRPTAVPEFIVRVFAKD
jgi:acyl-CoA thioester hydrolase